jgi:hypothetical protein
MKILTSTVALALAAALACPADAQAKIGRAHV